MKKVTADSGDYLVYYHPLTILSNIFMIVGWLFGFYGKSILMKIVLFQTIQFRISMQFKCKYSLIVKNISISSYSV